MQWIKNKYASDTSVVFILINTAEKGTIKERQEGIRNFLGKNSYNFQVLLDEATNDGNYKISGDNKILFLPTSFVVDSKGYIRYTMVGYDGDEERLKDILTKRIEYLKQTN